jgi:hypothetical protein
MTDMAPSRRRPRSRTSGPGIARLAASMTALGRLLLAPPRRPKPNRTDRVPPNPVQKTLDFLRRCVHVLFVTDPPPSAPERLALLLEEVIRIVAVHSFGGFFGPLILLLWRRHLTRNLQPTIAWLREAAAAAPVQPVAVPDRSRTSGTSGQPPGRVRPPATGKARGRTAAPPATRRQIPPPAGPRPHRASSTRPPAPPWRPPPFSRTCAKTRATAGPWHALIVPL